MNISSIVDTWIRLRQTEANGELSRLIHIAESRGINASNQVRAFYIRPDGLDIDTPHESQQQRAPDDLKQEIESLEGQLTGEHANLELTRTDRLGDQESSGSRA